LGVRVTFEGMNSRGHKLTEEGHQRPRRLRAVARGQLREHHFTSSQGSLDWRTHRQYIKEQQYQLSSNNIAGTCGHPGALEQNITQVTMIAPSSAAISPMYIWSTLTQSHHPTPVAAPSLAALFEIPWPQARSIPSSTATLLVQCTCIAVSVHLVLIVVHRDDWRRGGGGEEGRGQSCMLWQWKAATDRFRAFHFVASRVVAVSRHLLPAYILYRPMEGPSGRGSGVEARANPESGVPFLPSVRTRQPRAAPIDGTARSRAIRARSQYGEATVQARRPVLVLSPERVARNKKRAADKARSLSSIAACKRAAAAPVWHSGAVLLPSLTRSMMAAAPSAAAAESDSEGILEEGWAAPAALPCPPPSLLSLSSLPPPLPQHSRACPSSYVSHEDVRMAGVDAVVSAMKGGLARPGAGIFLLAGLLHGRQLSSVENAVAHVAGWRALLILSSKSVVEMQRLKGDADMGRRQLELPPGGGRTTINRATEELCSGCMLILDDATRRPPPRS